MRRRRQCQIVNRNDAPVNRANELDAAPMAL